MSYTRPVSVDSWEHGSVAMACCDVGGAIVVSSGLQSRGNLGCVAQSLRTQRQQMHCTAGSRSDGCGIRPCTHRFDGEQGGGTEDCAARFCLCRLLVPSIALLVYSDWNLFRHYNCGYRHLVISVITMPESECKKGKSSKSFRWRQKFDRECWPFLQAREGQSMSFSSC